MKDDENILKNKTQKLEYKAFPEAIIKIFRNTLVFKKKINFFLSIFN